MNLDFNIEKIRKLVNEINELKKARPVIPPLISEQVSQYNWEDMLIHMANRHAVNDYLSRIDGEYKWRAGRDLAKQMNARDTALPGRDTRKIYVLHRTLARHAEILGLPYESGTSISSFLRKNKDRYALFPSVSTIKSQEAVKSRSGSNSRS